MPFLQRFEVPDDSHTVLRNELDMVRSNDRRRRRDAGCMWRGNTLALRDSDDDGQRSGASHSPQSKQ